MPFDGLVVRAISHELGQKVGQARVERVEQPLREQVVLVLRTPGRKHRLLVSAEASAYRIHLTDHRETNPSSAYTFCQVLRKHLGGARVEAIEQPGLERVVRIVFAGRDEVGRRSRKTLIAEFMGKHSNILLLDEDGIILDGIKRYTHAVSRLRQVLPGVSYIAPVRRKRDPLQDDEAAFSETILQQPLTLPLFQAIQGSYEGLSQTTAREVVLRSGLDPDVRVDECGMHEMRASFTTLKKICEEALAARFSPCLLLDRNGQPLDFSALSLTPDRGLTIAPVASMNAALDAYYVGHGRRERLRGDRNALLSIVRKEMARVERRLAGAKETLEQAGEAQQTRICGELITANIHALTHGMREVVLEDFTGGEGHRIVLDPSLSPSANAQRYFKRYRKQKSAIARAAGEIDILSQERAYLDEVETSIDLATTIEELGEIREELTREGYIAAGRKPDKRSVARSEPVAFELPGGVRILVGRNGHQNDMVTFRLGKPQDIWLHARGTPGAHVVIKNGGQPVDSVTLQVGASLAAYFSRGRQAPNVPVDYTLCKHVKKPRGAKPGLVTYEHEKTIQASPALPSTSA